MEPLRPIVDLYTYRILEGQEFFKADHRYKIINIVNHFIRYKGKKMYLGNMLEEYVMMFSKNLKDGTELIFPILMIMRSMQMRYDVMRVLCMFDLPVDTDKEKENIETLRRNLFLKGLLCFNTLFI